jgi:hypothetical protein
MENEMPVEEIVKRLKVMEDNFITSPAPEYAEVCHYAIVALSASAPAPVAVEMEVLEGIQRYTFGGRPEDNVSGADYVLYADILSRLTAPAAPVKCRKCGLPVQVWNGWELCECGYRWNIEAGKSPDDSSAPAPAGEVVEICDSCRRQVNTVNCAYGITPVDGKCYRHSNPAYHSYHSTALYKAWAWARGVKG